MNDYISLGPSPVSEPCANMKAEDYYERDEKIKNVSLKDVRKFADIKNYSLAVIAPK